MCSTFIQLLIRPISPEFVFLQCWDLQGLPNNDTLCSSIHHYILSRYQWHSNNSYIEVLLILKRRSGIGLTVHCSESECKQLWQTGSNPAELQLLCRLIRVRHLIYLHPWYHRFSQGFLKDSFHRLCLTVGRQPPCIKHCESSIPVSLPMVNFSSFRFYSVYINNLYHVYTQSI